MVLSKDLKIAICFGLIMGAILSVCNLCFATEDLETIEPTIVSNIGITSNSNYFVATNASTAYIPLESGYIYHISVTSSYGHNLALSSSEPSLNAPYTFLTFLPAGQTYNYLATDDTYLYLSAYDSYTVSFTREKVEGMTSFIDSLAYSLSIDQLSSVWNLVVPILAISVLLGLGFYLLKRLLNKIKRAKGGA